MKGDTTHVFDTFSPPPGNERVVLGDGKVLPVKAVGSLELRFYPSSRGPQPSTETCVTLTDVYVLEGIWILIDEAIDYPTTSDSPGIQPRSQSIQDHITSIFVSDDRHSMTEAQRKKPTQQKRQKRQKHSPRHHSQDCKPQALVQSTPHTHIRHQPSRAAPDVRVTPKAAANRATREELRDGVTALPERVGLHHHLDAFYGRHDDRPHQR